MGVCCIVFDIDVILVLNDFLMDKKNNLGAGRRKDFLKISKQKLEYFTENIWLK